MKFFLLLIFFSVSLVSAQTKNNQSPYVEAKFNDYMHVDTIEYRLRVQETNSTEDSLIKVSVFNPYDLKTYLLIMQIKDGGSEILPSSQTIQHHWDQDINVETYEANEQFEHFGSEFIVKAKIIDHRFILILYPVSINDLMRSFETFDETLQKYSKGHVQFLMIHSNGTVSSNAF